MFCMVTIEAVAGKEEPHAGHHGWRRWIGLADDGPDPEAWVRIMALPVEDAQTFGSQRAASIVEALHRAGIEARPEPYVTPDSGAGLYQLQPSREARDRIQVAIMVRIRDRDAAHDLLHGSAQAGEPHQGVLENEMNPISDEELTRQALAATEELKREAGADE
jgi:hypothetical protein